jgi:hypothetical protein
MKKVSAKLEMDKVRRTPVRTSNKEFWTKIKNIFLLHTYLVLQI